MRGKYAVQRINEGLTRDAVLGIFHREFLAGGAGPIAPKAAPDANSCRGKERRLMPLGNLAGLLIQDALLDLAPPPAAGRVAPLWDDL
jgi:hypothetical protein